MFCQTGTHTVDWLLGELGVEAAILLKCSVRPVHTLHIGYLIEHNGDDEPHDYSLQVAIFLPFPDYNCCVSLQP